MLVLLAGFLAPPAKAGFRSPESLVRNVYAHYGSGAAGLSNGLPVGLQLVTRSGTEDTLFRTARWVWQVLH